jgi:hypothetical protein
MSEVPRSHCSERGQDSDSTFREIASGFPVSSFVCREFRVSGFGVSIKVFGRRFTGVEGYLAHKKAPNHKDPPGNYGRAIGSCIF